MTSADFERLGTLHELLATAVRAGGRIAQNPKFRPVYPYLMMPMQDGRLGVNLAGGVMVEVLGASPEDGKLNRYPEAVQRRVRAVACLQTVNVYQAFEHLYGRVPTLGDWNPADEPPVPDAAMFADANTFKQLLGELGSLREWLRERGL